MNKKPNPTLFDDDAPEWSETDFKNAKRLADMPANCQQTRVNDAMRE